MQKSTVNADFSQLISNYKTFEAKISEQLRAATKPVEEVAKLNYSHTDVHLKKKRKIKAEIKEEESVSSRRRGRPRKVMQ